MTLTRAQKIALTKMRDNGDDIVIEGGQVWVGDDRTNVKLVYNLLRRSLISCDDLSKIERYVINGTGRDALKSV
jgi:hypothetical protein